MVDTEYLVDDYHMITAVSNCPGLYIITDVLSISSVLNSVSSPTTSNSVSTSSN